MPIRRLPTARIVLLVVFFMTADEVLYYHFGFTAFVPRLLLIGVAGWLLGLAMGKFFPVKPDPLAPLDTSALGTFTTSKPTSNTESAE